MVLSSLVRTILMPPKHQVMKISYYLWSLVPFCKTKATPSKTRAEPMRYLEIIDKEGELSSQEKVKTSTPEFLCQCKRVSCISRNLHVTKILGCTLDISWPLFLLRRLMSLETRITPYNIRRLTQAMRGDRGAVSGEKRKGQDTGHFCVCF